VAAPGPTAGQGLETGPALLTPVQHSFFAQDLAPRSGFVQALLFAAASPLSTPALAAAMDLLVRHHDGLRLRFSRQGADWIARHVPPAEAVARVARVDLSALPPEHGRRELESGTAWVAEGFDLGAGPLVAAVAFAVGGGGEGGDRLLLSIHHLLVDGVSWRVLLADFETGYPAAGGSRPGGRPAQEAPLAAFPPPLSRVP